MHHGTKLYSEEHDSPFKIYKKNIYVLMDSYPIIIII